MNQYTAEDFERDFPDDETTRRKWREKNPWPDVIFCGGYLPLALDEIAEKMKRHLLRLEAPTRL